MRKVKHLLNEYGTEKYKCTEKVKKNEEKGIEKQDDDKQKKMKKMRKRRRKKRQRREIKHCKMQMQ